MIPDTSRAGVKAVTSSRAWAPREWLQMPPLRPPFSGGAPRNGGAAAVRPRPSLPLPAARASSPPGLRILVAGVDKDARGAVEASVRDALGSQAERGPWSISVVSMAGRWSVTLDGPDERLRGLSFVADGSRLVDAIREVLHGEPGGNGGAPTVAAAPVAAGSASERRDRHACQHCSKAVLVIYEERPGEGKALAAVACPHCWTIGHVEIGAWAASGGEYRAERG